MTEKENCAVYIISGGKLMKRGRKARTRKRCRIDALKVLAIMVLIIGVTVGIEYAIENLTIVQNLKINYETDPLGVSTASPVRFSWNMSSKVKGQSQKTYEIRVYEGESGQGTPIWTSGVVKSDESMNIAAEGLSLEREKRIPGKSLCSPAGDGSWYRVWRHSSLIPILRVPSGSSLHRREVIYPFSGIKRKSVG